MADWLRNIIEETQYYAMVSSLTDRLAPDSKLGEVRDLDADLDLPLPCEAILLHGDPCKNAAKHHLRVFCCACQAKTWVFYCDMHKLRLRAGEMACVYCFPAKIILKELTE